MNLTLDIKGGNGHTEVLFEGDKVIIKYHKTDPVERGLIEQLVEKGQKLGLVLYTSKKEEPTVPLADIKDVLMKKGGEIALKGEDEKVVDLVKEIVLKGPDEAVEKLAASKIEEELKKGRLVYEAQPDRTWKVLDKSAVFKPKKEKQRVSTSSPVVGG